ncbi:MAG: cyanophycinase [Balneolaceae bacterium]|nr:MAG: cyanophycinase [Balneolaceae bacterium]
MQPTFKEYHHFTFWLSLLFLMVSVLTIACGSSDSTRDIAPPDESANPYSLGRVGNPENIEASPKPGVLLMGGSTDVDEAMLWLLEQSGNGDIVIIRASGGDGYNQYLLDLGNANSVETLLINSAEAANDSRVAETIRSADALFIAGGNQANYINYWSNSKTEDAIQHLIHERGVPIGGTSAGCAIMGEFVFSALNGGVTSEEALTNPFDERLTVEQSTLINHPLLEGVITDQHFSQRNREGRAVVFLARIIDKLHAAGSYKPLSVIAVDERTAVGIDESGEMNVMGDHRVFFIHPVEDNATPAQLTEGTPFTWLEEGFPLGVFIADRFTNFSHTNSELPPAWSQMWNVFEGELIREAVAGSEPAD